MLVRVFIQERGAYKYENVRFVLYTFIFVKEKTADNHVSVLLHYGHVFSEEIWRHSPRLVTDALYDIFTFHIF